jgi:hypothetical protein
VIAMPFGPLPTPIVVVNATVLVAVSITLIELDRLLATKTWLPSGVVITRRGPLPTVMVPVTVFVAVSMMLTALPSTSLM